ncbi:MAG: 30S ribosomal protein S16 [Candidatus Omnitrophica bacterium]|nr:30S ribosomal protein S16 [Candidatus Omnitrophota bacterium]
MAVVIRLKRIGTTKRSIHRVVVTDSRSPRDGRFIEEIGFYNPKENPAVIRINKERVEYWLSVGAKPSVVVKSLIKKAGA